MICLQTTYIEKRTEIHQTVKVNLNAYKSFKVPLSTKPVVFSSTLSKTQKTMSSCGEAHALCRVCAKPFESSTMFRLLGELADAFWRVSEIEMQADGSRFPQSCCLKCRDRLQEVEELRALCLDSDRKLRKMIGIGLREEEEGDDIFMGNIDAIPKVEMQEVPESYSCWEDMENRFESSEEDNDEGNHLDSVPDVVKQTPGKTTKENAESKVKRKPKATKSGLIWF
uniref:(northern house mosquito) hypothetical protein n=1 Tax=Culex pipiens TaxID=7175 RepID=A0A8D8CYJ4_CULPI